MTEPGLDLTAMEARLNVALTTGDRSYDRHIQADQRALLAHCRALRAALRDYMVRTEDLDLLPDQVASYEQAAAVLAAAQGGETPPTMSPPTWWNKRYATVGVLVIMLAVILELECFLIRHL